MAETTTTKSHKDLAPGLIVLLINGVVIEQISTADSKSVDISLTVIEKKG